MSDIPRDIPPFDGHDMVGYMLKVGFELPKSDYYGSVCSMTNVRDIAIIVTEQCVLIAKADTRTGFRVELLTLI